MMQHAQAKRLATVKMIPAIYDGAFTQGNVRWWISNKDTNGFSKCMRRIGKKTLICLADFEKWVDEHQEVAQ